jgi:hypothetical protein
MKRFAFFILLCIAGQIGLFASEHDYLKGIPLKETPLQIRIGFSLVNITDVNEREETIDFDGALYISWKDERLAHDPASVGYPPEYVLGDHSQVPRLIYQGDFAVKEVFEGWRPHLVLTNGIGDRVKTNISLGIWPDGMVTYLESFYAKVETPMNLRLFPFDRQQLEFYFQTFGYRKNQLVLVPDLNLAGTWDRDMGIAQWKFEDYEQEERSTMVRILGGEVYPKSEFMATLHLERQPMHFLLSIILPLLILVILSWTVFWLDEEGTSNRINISFIGILSVVAYYFVIQDRIPHINYLTLIDGFIIITFLILAASVVISIVVDKLNRSGRRETGDKLDYISRWAFPSIYLLSTMILAALFFALS